MPHLLTSMPVHIPEICTKQCFGDYIKMSSEEKKCLIQCYERNSQLASSSNLRRNISLIF